MLEVVVNFFKSYYFWLSLGAYIGLIWVGLVLYTWFDVLQRVRARSIQIVFTLLSITGGIFGLLLYLLLRPRKTLSESASRTLEEKMLIKESLENMCPGCGFLVEKDYIFCPQCSSSLKKVCLSCMKISPVTFAFCPSCSRVENRMIRFEDLAPLGIIKRSPGRPKNIVLEKKILRGRGRPRKYPHIYEQPNVSPQQKRKTPISEPENLIHARVSQDQETSIPTN